MYLSRRSTALISSEIISMTDAKTRQCSRVGCDKRFSLVLRAGRNSGRAMAGRKRTYQDTRRYCSDACRKLASKDRRAPFNRPFARATTPVKAPEGRYPLSTVATAPNLVHLRAVSGAQKSTRPAFQMDFGSYTVVPDLEWPAMYRVRRPNGTLTDMVNLTRARDAARHFADQECRQEPLQRAA